MWLPKRLCKVLFSFPRLLECGNVWSNWSSSPVVPSLVSTPPVTNDIIIIKQSIYFLFLPPRTLLSACRLMGKTCPFWLYILLYPTQSFSCENTSAHLRGLNTTHIKNFKKNACCAVWVRNSVSHITRRTRGEVLGNRRQRKIGGPKRKEQEDWEDAQRSSRYVFHAKYSIISVIKSRRMKWAEHEALRGRRETHRVLVK